MTLPVPTDQNAETQKIGEAALRLRHVVGFEPSVAVKCAAAGLTVVGHVDLARFVVVPL